MDYESPIRSAWRPLQEVNPRMEEDRPDIAIGNLGSSGQGGQLFGGTSDVRTRFLRQDKEFWKGNFWTGVTPLNQRRTYADTPPEKESGDYASTFLKPSKSW